MKRYPPAVRDAILADYTAGIPIREIMQAHSVSKSMPAQIAREKGLEVRQPGWCRRYAIRHDYFDSIDSEDKAYFLGLLFADGHNDARGHYFSLCLSASDAALLDILASRVYLGEVPRKAYRAPGGTLAQGAFTLTVCSGKLSNALLSYGMTSNKSFSLSYPKGLPLRLESHLIRGYFDGDGSIVRYSGPKRRYMVSLIGNMSFLRSTQEALERHCAIKPTGIVLANAKVSRIHKFSVSALNDLAHFQDWIYANSTIFMQRKKERFDEFRAAFLQATVPRVKTSRFRGVSWCVARQIWEANCGRQKLGRFPDEREAALAYNRAAIAKGYPESVLNNVEKPK